MLKLRVRIVSSEVDPAMRDRLRRWLITAEVRAVREGTLPAGVNRISMLVHSPSRVFMDPEIVGREYDVTLQDPLTTDPYMGELSVAAEES